MKFQCICLPKNSHFSYTKIDPIYCDKQLVQPKLYSLKEGFYPCQPDAFVEVEYNDLAPRAPVVVKFKSIISLEM